MRLNARILKNVANVNNWEYGDTVYVQEGQSNDFYIQLVDLDMTPVEGDSGSLPEHPMRYLPQGTAISLEVTFPALRAESDDDGAEQFDVAATQPFTDDSSIWKVSLASDQTPKSGNINVSLTVDSNTYRFLITQAIQTSVLNVGSC